MTDTTISNDENNKIFDATHSKADWAPVPTSSHREQVNGVYDPLIPNYTQMQEAAFPLITFRE